MTDVLDAYRFPIEQQGFALESSLAEDLPEVEVDKEALSQALINLVNNAIKYSRDEKFIRLETARDGDCVRVSVTDRGIGIASGEQRKIFEKFYRAENSLVHETKGSGLGLALVRHIAEAHGGTVELSSAPGQGQHLHPSTAAGATGMMFKTRRPRVGLFTALSGFTPERAEPREAPTRGRLPLGSMADGRRSRKPQ